MYKPIVFVAFVCSFAVYASPSASASAARELTDCSSRPGSTVGVDSLQHTIKLQTEAIQRLTTGLNSTNAATHCDELVSSAVRAAVKAAVEPLERQLQQQAQAIESVNKNVNDVLAPLMQQLQLQAQAIVTVSNNVSDAISPLEQRLQQQNQAIESVRNAVRQIAIDSVAPLQRTVLELKQSIPSCGPDSGYRYFPTVNTCYKTHQDSFRWPQANTKCQSEDAHLAVINSEEEARVLTQVLKTKGWWCAIIGIYRDSNRVWRTVTGATLADAGYSKWKSGAPVADGLRENEKYGALLSSGTFENQQSFSNYFICEKAPL